MSTNPFRVYVAGPITKGDQAKNVRAAIDVSNEIANAGMFPFCPHLTWFWHMVHSHENQFWYEQDFPWLEVCHALYRIPGESVGSDAEEEFARERGIAVVRNMNELKTVFQAWNKAQSVRVNSQW